MKIEIRHAEVDDYKAIHRIYTQPRVVWGTMQLPYSSTERQRKRLAEPQEGAYTLVASVDREVIGHLNLKTFTQSPRRKHSADIGMGVHDDWQGQGVGSALLEAAIDLADCWLNLTRLGLTVFIDNEPAVHLYKKFGFEIEGTLRQYAFRDGQLEDVYTMGRLINEERKNTHISQATHSPR